MTDKEILINVLKKAKMNGYEVQPLLKCLEGKTKYNYFIKSCIGYIDEDFDGGQTFSLKEVIFSHEFAKAFWQNEKDTICSYYDGGGNKLEDWQYHLQQMVLCEEPLKYLKTFLDNI